MPRPDPPKEHQFKKGQSGNPNGRPKKLPELDKLLDEVLGDEKDGVTAAQAILMKLRQQAIAGNIRAAEVLINRGYGLPKQNMDIVSAGEKLTGSLLVIHEPPAED